MKHSDSQANREELNFRNRKTHCSILAAIHLKELLHSELLHFLPRLPSQSLSGSSLTDMFLHKGKIPFGEGLVQC